MSIVTKQIREGYGYLIRIVAVGLREEGRLTCPVLDFLKTQRVEHPDLMDQLTALLEYSARNRPPKNEKKFEYVAGTEGIYEFKAFQLRLLCFWDEGNLIVCTNGTVKKRDRADQSVINTAEQWKKSYFEAKQNNLLRHEREHE